MRFTAAWGRQAFKIGGKFKFWGGLTVEAVGGGPGLVESLTQIAKKDGIEIWYRRARLSLDRRRFRRSWRRRQDTSGKTLEAARQGRRPRGRRLPGRITEWRTRYMGPGWELAKVRGTRFNTGDAHPHGARHRRGGARQLVGLPRGGLGPQRARDSATSRSATSFQKHSYPWGVYINADGRRFVDEGADFRNYTYAKYGRVILQQPGQFAWQIFDAKVKAQLRDEYQHQAGDQASPATRWRSWCSKLDDTDQKTAPRGTEAVQRGRADRHSLQSQRQGWKVYQESKNK